MGMSCCGPFPWGSGVGVCCPNAACGETVWAGEAQVLRLPGGTDTYFLELLNRLGRLASLRLNFVTPTKKAIGYTADGRKKRIYDKPATPWQRLKSSDVLDAHHLRSWPHASTGLTRLT